MSAQPPRPVPAPAPRAAAPAPDPALTALWAQAEPRVHEQLARVEDAVAAVLLGHLGEDAREAARRDAHKLAGALGSFGVVGATEPARALEHAFAATPGLAEAPRLAERALALRRAIERGPAPEPPASAAGTRVVLAGLDGRRAGAVVDAAQDRGWHLSTIPTAAAAEGADVVLLGRAAASPAAVAQLARAGTAVAVTDDAGDPVELVRAGARRLLPAALEPAALVAELADLETGRDARAATVLALDDDPIVLTLLEAALERAGHRIVTVADPDAFWATLETARPDLVVLDVQLPGVDGTALCRALRADPRWRLLPVLFLTATTDAASIGELFAAGADDYVLKPVDGPEVAARIAGRLERTRQLRTAADTDELTGLLRPEAAEVAIARDVEVAGRLRQPLCVAAVRVDGLDARADRDAALAATAGALRGVLGAGDVAARWAGDELVIAMPGVGGHDARSRLGDLLEAARRLGGTAPVTLSAGVAEHPGDGADVAALVAGAVAARRAAEAAGGDRVAGTGSDREDRVDVALVEDDEVLARLVLHALETRGYRVRWIPDGDEACRLLGGPRPPLAAGLVLLDWDLPARDGLTVLRLLAADGALATTRVVMLTMRASEREVLTALELGATDHVAKPFSVAVLMQRVRTVLAR